MSTEKRKLYLAYGSNLNVFQMRRRCPGAKMVGAATIPDYQLLFKGSGSGAYLTIEPKPGSSVPVGVWSVTASDEDALDVYEGFPDFYYKKEMTVEVKEEKSGETRERETFVYIMHEERPLGWPSGAYVRTCMDGYRAFGFDYAFLMDALKASVTKEDE